MIEKIKHSRFGQTLYRFSRRPVIGRPVLMLAKLLQSDALNLDHVKAKNRAHNARQMEILAAFERERRS
ncbi:MAG: hypothetical protein AAGL96_10440 [Pseudomonadota bacterium]